MAFTLARDELTDEELVELIGRGDLRAAACFWVRHWPTALTASRGLVEPAEVPGLAAEALIGTLAAVRVGTGPRDHAAVFVIDAVHELGGEEYLVEHLAGPAYPDVFASSTMAAAFDDLPIADRQLLWAALADGYGDADLATSLGTTAAEAAARHDAALGELQTGYLRRHAAVAVRAECATTHELLAAAVADPSTTLPRETGVHVSECVVCTEAFHELAHSSVDLRPLLGAGAYPGPLPTAAQMPRAVAAPVLEETPAPEPTEVPAPLPAFDPAPEPVSVAKAAILPELDGEVAEEPRRRRSLALVLTAAGLAAAVALAFNLTGGSSGTTPLAAGAAPEDTPTGQYSAPSLPGVDPAVATPSTTASGSATPTATPTGTASPDDAVTDEPDADDPTPSSTPSRTPTSKPTPATPTKTSTPDPDPTPTPTPSDPPATEVPEPTPTKAPCNLVQKLLGLC
jgi:hypothetical protein